MPIFLVSYSDTIGRRRELTLEADSPASARRSLRQRGILPTTLVRKDSAAALPTKAKKPRSSSWQDLMEGGVSVKDKALFANKLAALVDAGVPIIRSLDLMRTQQRSAKMRRALTAITNDINQGETLGQSMRRWPQVFDTLTVAMVEAGEVGGVLDETLRRLAVLLEETARLQNQIRGALGYPIAVLVIAILVFLGMTIFLIPTFAEIFKELGAELPIFTQMMLNLSNLLRSAFSIVLVGIIILGVYFFGRFYATEVGRRQVDALILKLPLFGDLIQKTATAQFCRTLSSLSRAGVPILQALEVVRETTNNSVIGDAILSSRNEVSEGLPLSSALRMKNVFPDMAISMLAIGEETGEMDTMLSKVADFYEDEVTTAVKTLTSLIEPAMIVLVGGIVGSILVAMYLPMFSIFDKIR
ncbi:MAG: type II secretion system F family protein [Synechococcaceae cyanobacterium]|nr:type II secretion system F family protein [Synechococcaceae cyanobacterium]